VASGAAKHETRSRTQPIARFAEDLRRQGQTEAYMSLLANSFNPTTVESLMCRTNFKRRLDGRSVRLRLQQMLGLQMRMANRLPVDVTPELLRLAVRRRDIAGLHGGLRHSCGGALETAVAA